MFSLVAATRPYRQQIQAESTGGGVRNKNYSSLRQSSPSSSPTIVPSFLLSTRLSLAVSQWPGPSDCTTALRWNMAPASELPTSQPREHQGKRGLNSPIKPDTPNKPSSRGEARDIQDSFHFPGFMAPFTMGNRHENKFACTQKILAQRATTSGRRL